MPILSRRRLLQGVAGVAVALLLAVGLALATGWWWAERWMRQEVERQLSRKLDATVTLADLSVRLLPRVRVAGAGLTIRLRGQEGVPPIVVVREFAGTTDLVAFLARRLHEVRVDGLEITIARRRAPDGRSTGDVLRGLGKGKDTAPEPPAPGDVTERQPDRGFRIDRVEAVNTRMTVLSRNPAKNPKVWDIHALTIEALTLDEPSPFQAEITNPIPVGTVKVIGRFGPWVREEPSLMPIEGDYTFEADLGTIKGVRGALAARGRMDGVIEAIATSGSTQTPDFGLKGLKGGPMPLATTYDAEVDGTNGDVTLKHVRATLGGSVFDTAGTIAGTKGIKGKRVQLAVKASQAEVGDVLRLLVDVNRPALTGALTLDATMDLPPGEPDVLQRLDVAGTFALKQARFASDTVQDKIDEFSRRGQGRPKDPRIDDVVSNMSGRFRVHGGRLALPSVRFGVTGATVQMAGAYGLESEALDFRGVVRLAASASRTQTGYKSWLLKPFDPLLRKDGAGTRLVVTVNGTRDAPKFGLDMGATLKGKR
jgi:hypothetical protein